MIISLIDIDSNPVLFAKNEQIKSILRISFNDVDRDSFGAMNENDANSIVSFCAKWLPDTNLIVHCEAGVSRSAGVCAAILKRYEGSDMQIFGNAYYRPNMHCYREVLKAFERSVNYYWSEDYHDKRICALELLTDAYEHGQRFVPLSEYESTASALSFQAGENNSIRTSFLNRID